MSKRKPPSRLYQKVVFFATLSLVCVCCLHGTYRRAFENDDMQLIAFLRAVTTASVAYSNELLLESSFGKEGNYVLVAGAAGYIGSHMSMLLLEEGYRVLGVDNMSRGSQLAIDALKVFDKFEFREIDLTDEGAVKFLFAKNSFRAVFHFADFAFVPESMEKPDMYRGVTFSKVYNLVHAMIEHRVSPLLYSSSCSVYGSPTKFPVTTESPTAPLSPYGEAKLNAENFIRSKVSDTFQAHAFRYFNVIGADHKTRLGENPRPELSRFGRLWTAVTETAKGQRPCVTLRATQLPGTTDGSAERDFVHVEDIALAHLYVWEKSPGNSQTKNPFNVWNVATERPYSTLQFLETAKNISGVHIPICYGSTPAEHFEPPRIYGSAAKLRALGWKPKYKSLNEMLKTAWKWEEKKIAALPASSPKPRKSNEYDVCIVGAGLSGAVIAERYANEGNKTVLVMEKRHHIGGNCYDYIDKETGIRVSRYGVKLFHTQDSRVWKYVQQFSNWTQWEHQVAAKVGDQYVPVPVNINSVNALFGLNISSEEEMKSWLGREQIVKDDQNYTNSEEIALSLVGGRLYNLIYKPSTIKKWNTTPSELDPSFLGRIHVRANHDNRYFTDDVHQAYPTLGYTKFFENLLQSPKITVRLNTDYFREREKLNCSHTYFTGPIDEYFASHNLEKLDYRSLRFERKVYRDTEYFQPQLQVNYPSLSYNYTRVLEYKHLLQRESKDTVVVYEYPADSGEPFYPIPNQKNQDLYAKYQKLALKERDVSFVGRLATYSYLTMDQAISNALKTYYEHTCRCKPGVFESVKQWKALFPPDSFQFQEKVLIAIPIVTTNARSVDKLIKGLNRKNFDFNFFVDDHHNWTKYEWFDEVSIDYRLPGMVPGWGLAKRFLTPDAVSPYSHICFWDTVLEPTDDFDGDVFIQLLQGFHLDIVQPQAGEWSQGSSSLNRPPTTQLHEVHSAENIAPCYSRKVWSNCIWPNLNPHFSSGKGVYRYLHKASCAPTWSHSVRLPVDHSDQRSTSETGNYSGEVDWYHDLAKTKGWLEDTSSNGCNPKSYQVAVDGACQLYLDAHLV